MFGGRSKVSTGRRAPCYSKINVRTSSFHKDKKMLTRVNGVRILPIGSGIIIASGGDLLDMVSPGFLLYHYVLYLGSPNNLCSLCFSCDLDLGLCILLPEHVRLARKYCFVQVVPC